MPPIVRRRNIDTIDNTLERRATMIVDMLEDQAQRMVDAMDEPPPGMSEPDSATVRAMWDYSPYPNPEQAFWQLHDMTLPMLLAQVAAMPELSGDARLRNIRAAHQMAEQQALEKVYPKRALVAMLGITTIERSVKLADHAARLAAQEDKQQGTPEMAPAQEVAY